MPVSNGTGTIDRDDILHRQACKQSSDALLARLIRYHGDHPPDAEAAEAVARIRADIVGRRKLRRIGR